MFLHSTFAIVAFAGLLCTAAPPTSDLSHRSMPLIVSSGSEDFSYTEVNVLKRDAKVEEARCFCPGTQFAVHFGGKCECIDDSFGGVKRDALPDTEEASCFCPGNQIAVHFGGKCECIDDGFGKQDVKERAIVGNSILEKRTLTPFVKCPADCPATTRPEYYEIAGEVRCTCRPLGDKSHPNKCYTCPADTNPWYWNDGKYCKCWTPRSPDPGPRVIPYAKCLDTCSPLTYHVAFADENGVESCLC